MSRNAVIITLDALKELCKTKLKIGTEDFEIEDLSSTIIKDISKIQFDFENYDLGNAEFNFEKYPTDYKGYHNYPVGYEVLSNGLPKTIEEWQNALWKFYEKITTKEDEK